MRTWQWGIWETQRGHKRLWAAQREVAGGTFNLRCSQVPCGESKKTREDAWGARSGAGAEAPRGLKMAPRQHGGPSARRRSQPQPGDGTKAAGRQGAERALKAGERPELALRWSAGLGQTRSGTARRSFAPQAPAARASSLAEGRSSSLSPLLSGDGRATCSTRNKG